MLKKEEHFDAIIHENTYEKNGRVYHRYYFNFEGEKYSYSSREKAYQVYCNLFLGEEVRKKKKSNQQIAEHKIEEEIKKWFNDYKNKHKPSTVERTWSTINYQIIPQVGNIKIKSLTYDDVNNMVTKCQSKSTARKAYGYLKQFYKENNYMKFLEDNPFENIKYSDFKVANERAVFEYWETARIIENCEHYPSALGIFILTKTGMRCGEALALNNSDIKFKIGKDSKPVCSININRTISHGSIYDDNGIKIKNVTEPLNPKTSNGKREIPISLETYIKIIELLAKTKKKSEAEVLEEMLQNPNAPLLIAKNKKRLSYVTLRFHFEKLLKECEIIQGDRTVHSLRHTFATDILRKGARVEDVSRYLGHAKTSTTYNLYVHGTSEGIRDFI